MGRIEILQKQIENAEKKNPGLSSLNRRKWMKYCEDRIGTPESL